MKLRQRPSTTVFLGYELRGSSRTRSSNGSTLNGSMLPSRSAQRLQQEREGPVLLAQHHLDLRDHRGLDVRPARLRLERARGLERLPLAARKRVNWSPDSGRDRSLTLALSDGTAITGKLSSGEIHLR